MAGERRRIRVAARPVAENDPLARGQVLIPLTVTKRNVALCLIVTGLVVFGLGYRQSDPRFARPSNRPYAYVSIMAVGAILAIGGGLLWRDR